MNLCVDCTHYRPARSALWRFFAGGPLKSLCAAPRNTERMEFVTGKLVHDDYPRYCDSENPSGLCPQFQQKGVGLEPCTKTIQISPFSRYDSVAALEALPAKPVVRLRSLSQPPSRTPASPIHNLTKAKTSKA